MLEDKVPSIPETLARLKRGPEVPNLNQVCAYYTLPASASCLVPMSQLHGLN